jgi:hypothetical protein
MNCGFRISDCGLGTDQTPPVRRGRLREAKPIPGRGRSRETKPIRPAVPTGTRPGGRGQLYEQTQSGVASRVEGGRREQTKPICPDVARGTQGGGRVQTKPTARSGARGGVSISGRGFKNVRNKPNFRRCRGDKAPGGLGMRGERAKQSQFRAGRGGADRTKQSQFPAGPGRTRVGRRRTGAVVKQTQFQAWARRPCHCAGGRGAIMRNKPNGHRGDLKGKSFMGNELW